MATLYIGIWVDARQTLIGAPNQEMTVAVGATSAQSAVIANPANGKAIRRCRLYADVDCFVTWGTDPTAVDGTNSRPMGADNPETFDIEAGQKIAVIERA